MDYCYSVYPRWRGEHGRTEYKAVYLLGLSPLAREHWLCNSSTHDHVGLSPLARGTRNTGER
ncbi:hypothetical protein [Escherichia coli]|uniref:hypothetical protein n=1 Tax=Escherichia coli TaxID=562 RepID=UPI003D9BCAE0